MKTNYEARNERIDRLRISTENRYCARIERLEKKAAPMIGELCREGATIHYAFPVGGKYFESASWVSVADYLIKNKYVR